MLSSSMTEEKSRSKCGCQTVVFKFGGCATEFVSREKVFVAKGPFGFVGADDCAFVSCWPCALVTPCDGKKFPVVASSNHLRSWLAMLAATVCPMFAAVGLLGWPEVIPLSFKLIPPVAILLELRVP